MLIATNVECDAFELKYITYNESRHLIMLRFVNNYPLNRP